MDQRTLVQYKSTDFIAPGPGKLELTYTPADGGDKVVMNVYDFKGPGVALSMYNTDEASQLIAHVLVEDDREADRAGWGSCTP